MTTPIATQILVNVPETTPPEITLEPPQINVLPPVPRAYDVRITERDENGFILAFRIEPRMSQGCAVLDGRGSVPAARFSGSRVAGA